MPDDRRQKNIRIKGNSNVVGNNNVVNSRREEHHHHHSYGGSSKGGRGSDDAAGIGLGALFAVLVICWVFVRHATEIYFYIKLGALVCAVPFLVVVALVLSSNAIDNKQIVAAIWGLTLSMVTFFLAQYGQNRFDPQLLQFSYQAPDAFAFWKGLSEYGHNVVVGNLIGAICLGASVFFSMLMGVFVLWHFLSDVDWEDSSLLRILNPFRPSRGGVLTVVLLIAAWAFESGIVLDTLWPTTSS